MALRDYLAWHDDAGFEPRALVVGDGNLFGVGAAQFRGPTTRLQRGIRAFGEFFR